MMGRICHRLRSVTPPSGGTHVSSTVASSSLFFLARSPWVNSKRRPAAARPPASARSRKENAAPSVPARPFSSHQILGTGISPNLREYSLPGMTRPPCLQTKHLDQVGYPPSSPSCTQTKRYLSAVISPTTSWGTVVPFWRGTPHIASGLGISLLSGEVD